MFKLMIVGRRRGGMTVAQLHHYMIHEHGAMVLKAIAVQPQLTPQRYVQNHVSDGSFRVPGAAADPFSVARDFVTEVWFDSPAQAKASVEAPFYLEQLQPDEDKFVDQASVVKLPVHEQPVAGPAVATGRVKLFVFQQRAEAVTVDDLVAGTLALWQPLLADGELGIEKLLRNRVLQAPNGRAAVDLVDALWLADAEAARRLIERWQALAAANSALFTPGSGFVLLAQEHRLHTPD